MQTSIPLIIRYHYQFPSLPSTQAYARQYFQSLRPGYPVGTGFVFMADRQTQGEGTQKRPWVSLKGNVFFTLGVVWPALSAHILATLPLAAALAIAETIEEYGITPQLKWVNDVLIAGKKVAGVLCENRSLPACYSGQRVILIGIGVNLCQAKTLGTQVDQPVTSLEEMGQGVITPRLFYDRLMPLLQRHILQVVEGKTELFMQALSRFPQTK